MSSDQRWSGLSAEEFVDALAEENNAALARLGDLSRAGETPEALTVPRLLRVALKNEFEASELAAIWMASTSELDVKLALARQVGDEARHYRLIAQRLMSLGVDANSIDPRDGWLFPAV